MIPLLVGYFTEREVRKLEEEARLRYGSTLNVFRAFVEIGDTSKRKESSRKHYQESKPRYAARKSQEPAYRRNYWHSNKRFAMFAMGSLVRHLMWPRDNFGPKGTSTNSCPFWASCLLFLFCE